MSGAEKRPPLLLEIVCEEIPARAIAAAAEAFKRGVAALLDDTGVPRGEGRAWGGSRRLAVRFRSVAAGLPPKEEEVLGPPAKVAFAPDGSPSKAGVGFAQKQGIDPSRLTVLHTAKGEYAGFRRQAPGRTLEEILQEALPPAVNALPFPKTMRWGSGAHRWVRPVHALVALHGSVPLALRLFDVIGADRSLGHRFRAPGAVTVSDADAYESALREAFVLVDPVERRTMLAALLREAAIGAGGEWVADASLLEEVADLVEWPGVVAGAFDRRFLELPRELLTTTLRHHQKSFTVESRGSLLPAFLSVANSDVDPSGHIRRGNEWVVSGRLEDARFFWDEDRNRPLASRIADLGRVTFHAALGTYADKSRRIVEVVRRLSEELGAPSGERTSAEDAAACCKADLTTGLVGEFPELQGVVGGLLLRAEGAPPGVALAVYEHYRPAGADDDLPTSFAGSLVAAADRLDTIGGLVGAGERPTGSRDPFGLRRAANGVFRIVLDRGWSLSLRSLANLAGGGDPVWAFLTERFENFLKDTGATPNEVAAILRADDGRAVASRTLPDLRERLGAIREIRERDDFAHLVDLVKRVANIRRKNPELVEAALGWRGSDADPEPAVEGLVSSLRDARQDLDRFSADGNYGGAVDVLARLVDPVDLFFDRALVVNPDDRDATYRRLRLLENLESTLTSHFDLRELPGAADRRG